MWGVANGVRTIGEGGQPIAYRGGEGVKKGQKNAYVMLYVCLVY